MHDNGVQSCNPSGVRWINWLDLIGIISSEKVDGLKKSRYKVHLIILSVLYFGLPTQLGLKINGSSQLMPSAIVNLVLNICRSP